MVSILIVDDDVLISSLLQDFLSSQDTIEVQAVCSGGNQLLDYLEQQKNITTDVIILDLKMKEGSGLETMEVLQQKYPNIKVIALSSYFKVAYTGHLLQKGFHAFLPKETTKEELLEVIYTVHKNGSYLSEEQVDTLRNQISHKIPKTVTHTKDTLTVRELEVLKLLFQQLSAKEIAEKLFISTKTVEAHKSNLLLKTECKNTAGLVVYAIQNGLININQMLNTN